MDGGLRCGLLVEAQRVALEGIVLEPTLTVHCEMVEPLMAS